MDLWRASPAQADQRDADTGHDTSTVVPGRNADSSVDRHWRTGKLGIATPAPAVVEAIGTPCSVVDDSFGGLDRQRSSDGRTDAGSRLIDRALILGIERSQTLGTRTSTRALSTRHEAVA